MFPLSLPLSSEEEKKRRTKRRERKKVKRRWRRRKKMRRKKRKRRRRRRKTVWIFRSMELFYWIHQLSKPIEWCNTKNGCSWNISRVTSALTNGPLSWGVDALKGCSGIEAVGTRDSLLCIFSNTAKLKLLLKISWCFYKGGRREITIWEKIPLIPFCISYLYQSLS